MKRRTFIGLVTGALASLGFKTPNAPAKGLGVNVYQLKEAKETHYIIGIDPAKPGSEKSVFTYMGHKDPIQWTRLNAPNGRELEVGDIWHDYSGAKDNRGWPVSKQWDGKEWRVIT